MDGGSAGVAGAVTCPTGDLLPTTILIPPVALAGLRVRADRYEGKNVVAIICGGNISRETLKEVI